MTVSGVVIFYCNVTLIITYCYIKNSKHTQTLEKAGIERKQARRNVVPRTQIQF